MKFEKPVDGNDLMQNYTYNLIGIDKKSPLPLKSYEILEEIELGQVLGNVDLILKKLSEFQSQYPQFENLRIESISYRSSQSVFEQATFLLGERWENEIEVKQRLS